MSALPPILDACCGNRMFWYDKQNPNVLFADRRQESVDLSDGRTLHISPDVVADFRAMPWPDDTFKLVVFDPPHLTRVGATSDMAKKYGKLDANWREDITQGFTECWRVLAPGGVLIFKWNQRDIKVSEVLQVIGREPLFGHTTNSSGSTVWMCFMRLGSTAVDRSTSDRNVA